MLTLSKGNKSVTHVCLQLFRLESTRHEQFRLPQLILTQSETVVSYDVCYFNLNYTLC